VEGSLGSDSASGADAAAGQRTVDQRVRRLRGGRILPGLRGSNDSNDGTSPRDRVEDSRQNHGVTYQPGNRIC